MVGIGQTELGCGRNFFALLVRMERMGGLGGVLVWELLFGAQIDDRAFVFIAFPPFLDVFFS